MAGHSLVDIVDLSDNESASAGKHTSMALPQLVGIRLIVKERDFARRA